MGERKTGVYADSWGNGGGKEGGGRKKERGNREDGEGRKEREGKKHNFEFTL